MALSDALFDAGLAMRAHFDGSPAPLLTDPARVGPSLIRLMDAIRALPWRDGPPGVGDEAQLRLNVMACLWKFNEAVTHEVGGLS